MADDKKKFYYQDNKGRIKVSNKTYPTEDDLIAVFNETGESGGGGTGDVASISVNNETYTPDDNGVVTLPDYPEAVEYTAGTNVSINDGVISAADTTYTAGTNINISNENVISATDTNTWRSIKINGTEKFGTGTNTNALNLKNGTGITIAENNGDVTISSSASGGDIQYSFAGIFKDKVADFLGNELSNPYTSDNIPSDPIKATCEIDSTNDPLFQAIFSNTAVQDYLSDLFSEYPEQDAFCCYIGLLTNDLAPTVYEQWWGVFQFDESGEVVNPWLSILITSESAIKLDNDVYTLISFGAQAGSSDAPDSWALFPMTDAIARLLRQKCTIDWGDYWQ